MNVAEHVWDIAKDDPDRVALVCSGESWTYGELSAAATLQEAQLADLGTVAGDRVAILLRNSVTFVVVYLACVRRGYVPVPVNPHLSDDELDYILGDSAPTVVVAPHGFDQIGNAPRSTHLLRLPPTAPRPAAPISLLEMPAPADLDPMHPATLFYTSGTTGRPKGALLSHHNVIFTMQSKVQCLELQPADVLLLFLPLVHCYGLNAILNPAFLAGSTVVIADRFDRHQTLNLANEHGVTRFFSVPQVFRLLLDTGVTPARMPTVRYALSAGDVLHADVRRAWRRRMGWPIHEAYGLTETSPFVTYNKDPDRHSGSVGSAIDDVEVAIRSESGKPMPDGEIGEVWVRGPNVMLGYWNASDATAEAIIDGWLRTSDYGWVDDAGYLYLAGRSNEIIIVAGRNVYTREVERVLLADDNVIDATVYGVPHEIAGEIVAASVIPRHGDVTTGELRASCVRSLAEHKVPTVIDLVDSLPTLNTGKRDRRTLVAMTRARMKSQRGTGDPS